MRRVFLCIDANEHGLANYVRERLESFRDVKTIEIARLGARPQDAAQAVAAELRDSDVFLGVFGAGGGTPADRYCYESAREQGIPCLVYLSEGPERDDDAGAFRASLRERHLAGRFAGRNDLALSILTDLHNLVVATTPRGVAGAPAIGPAPAQVVGSRAADAAKDEKTPAGDDKVELPEPVKWLKGWWHYLFPAKGHRSAPSILAKWAVAPFLLAGLLVKLDVVPDFIVKTGKVWAENGFIFLGVAAPRCATEPGEDGFTGKEDTPDGNKWSVPGSWKLVNGENPAGGHQRMQIVDPVQGARIGYFKAPSRFETYCDCIVQFQVPITAPDKQKGVSWVLRYQSSAGGRYYRFDLTFPQKGDKPPASLKGTVYRGGAAQIEFAAEPIPSKPVMRAGGILEIQSKADSFGFTHVIGYITSCSGKESECPDPGWEQRIAMEDSSRTWGYGFPGFLTFPGETTGLVQAFNVEPLRNPEQKTEREEETESKSKGRAKE